MINTTNSPTSTPQIDTRAHVSAGLCYLFGWISGLVFFSIERSNRALRFHAAQSIVLFGAITIASLVIGILSMVPGLGVIFRALSGLVGVAGVGLWLLCLVLAFQGKDPRFPYAGDMAEWLVRK